MLQRNVGGQRILEGLAVNRCSHDEPADHVDCDDEDAYPDVARYELRGSVHCPVEVNLPLKIVLLAGRLLLGKGSRVVLGLDRHLLAGQRVQGEARRHLGDSGCTLRDDDKLNCDDDDEYDEPDDQSFGALRANHEAGKGANDPPAKVLPLREDEPRRADVEGKPKDRCHEKQRGKDREIQRVLGVENDEYDEEREHQVEGKQDVKKNGWQRDDHHHHDDDDARGNEDVALLGEERGAYDPSYVGHWIPLGAAARVPGIENGIRSRPCSLAANFLPDLIPASPFPFRSFDRLPRGQAP